MRQWKNWRWVQCRATDYGDCCTRGVRDGDSEFMGCGADWHNDWVAERWYRRWIANVREWWAGL